MIAEVLEGLFTAILKSVRAEQTESARIARAKREVLALSLRLGSDAMLRRLLKKGGAF